MNGCTRRTAPCLAVLVLAAACASPDLSGPRSLHDPAAGAPDAATSPVDAPVTDPGHPPDPGLAPDLAHDPGAAPDAAGDAPPDTPAPADAPDAADEGPDVPDADAADPDVPVGPPLVCEPWTRAVLGDMVELGADEIVLDMHHVRYREDEGLFGGAWHDHPDFPFWDGAGHDITSRTAMFVSEPWRPDPSAVTDVVLLAAGQQGIRQTPGAFANISTGQQDGWRPDGPNKIGDAEIRIRRQSVAGRILEDGVVCSGSRYGFGPANTVVLLAFDAGYNYMLSAEAKQAAVDGYLAWIDARVGDPSRVRRVFVGGTSRGGCLALRLARGLLDDPRYADARVQLGTLDAVCQPEQAEGGTTTVSPIPNPLHPGFIAYRTDLAAFFPQAGLDRIAVRQVVGGGPVIDLLVAGIAHAFVDAHADADPPWSWPFDYEATWIDLGHNDIGRPWRAETSGALLDWLEAHFAKPDRAR